MNIEEKVEHLEKEIDVTLTELKKDIEYIKTSVEDIKLEIWDKKNGLIKRIEDIEKNQIATKVKFSVIIFVAVIIANLTASYLFKVAFK
jgi:hypothetical protein